MILTLIQNISILIALSVVYQIIASKLEKGALRSRVLSGILFGCFGVVGMMTPLRYAPGIIYDGRSIILGVSGLIGGPVAAVIAAFICAGYRLYLGGAGAFVGVSVAAEAAAVGVCFHYLRHRYPRVMDLLPLLGFGLLIHIVMLLMMLGLPGGVGPDVLRQITLPVLLVYPAATMLLARTVFDAERRHDVEKTLRENEEKYRNLVENSTGIIWEADTSARFTYISGQTRTILGYEPWEMIGRSAFEFMEPSRTEEIRKRFRSARGNPASILGVETHFVKRDGSIVVVETRATPMFTSRGTWAGFHGVDIDITERKRTEEALRQSHREKAILNEIAGVFLTVQDDRIYGQVLAAFLKAMDCEHGIFGYIDQNGDMVIPGTTEKVWNQCRIEGRSIVFPAHVWEESLWGKVVREKKSFVSSGPFQLPEGHLPVRNFLAAPIIFGDNPIGLLAAANKEGPFTAEDQALLEHIAVNVSPILNARLQRDRQELVRKKVEEALRSSEQRLADIIDFLPDATFAVDDKGIVIAWNRAIEEMTGVPKEEMIGRGDHEYALPFYGKRRPLMVDLVFADEEEIRKDYVGVSRSGNTIVAEAFVGGAYGGKGAYLWGIATPLYDKSGKVAAAIESIRDVTERKMAEATLTRAEAKYRAIFENAMESIFQTTPDGRYITANPAHATMLGYDSPDELMNSITDIGRQVYTVPVQRLEVQRLLAKEDHIKDFEIQLTRKDGTAIWVTIDVATIRDPAGNILYYQGTMLDITDRRRAAEERERLEAQLQHAQKMESVGRLAGGVAHDFNNMLNVIIGHAEMVLDQMIPSERFYHNLHEIRNAAYRSADLVRQLLAFARRQMARPRLLDLNETIENMLKMLRRMIGEDIDLVWTPRGGLWNVKIDPSQIDQILANLAVNARDAISGVGTITIETQNVVLDDSYCAGHAGFIPGEYVQLTVSDTGAGMNKEVLEHLFEPFFTTKGIGQGTGLGLATVYGIVKQNEGFINVYSEPSKGATFKIYLPRFEAQPELLREEQAPGRVSHRGEETIMLVEDDESLLDLSRRILEDLGYTVVPTQSPMEAIRLVSEYRGEIHLLITDVVMPEMNGRELEEHLLKIRPSLKCLYMSGYTANMIAHRGILEEGVHFISKPFGRDDLAEKVRLALTAT